ncbi:hypothetical protein HG535_0A02580 [Zygotorulaspora mrakii]|uniref:PPM-type phosphatase domain-containing protein n=1 Tax=Zygotorulaspora mrakii TaxID=42260 RepID=A0A7H9AVE0_ZYGMR|nr:uncharacterized protein HG535_0A02580 [Zygotorulaspora mrakii]QLG70320.1 hypothetical protein HG535_0A02580 [Zygotorulaspora mrakii]
MMSSVIRTVKFRRSSKVLVKALSRKQISDVIYRTYFVGTSRLSGSSSGNPNGNSSSSDATPSNKYMSPFKSRRDLKFALVGGSMLVLTYSYFSSKSVLSLDTVKGIRQYTTGPVKGPNGSSTAANGGSASSSGGNDSITLLTESEVNAKLQDLQESYFVNRGKGVLRYDVAQLPSNNPIEDSHVEQIVTVPSTNSADAGVEEDLCFFGIFDGHSGCFTSKKLSTDLVPYVAQNLGKIYSDNSEVLSSSKLIDTAIEDAFVQLDNDIVYGSLRNLFKNPTKEAMVHSLPAISGSCALLCGFNSYDSTIKVAVSGDSRALLCGLDDTDNWVVQSLSTDQTGDNPREVERIRSEHPGEDNVIRNGRVLGSLQPSRAFGDYRYKVKEIDGKSLAELPEHVKIYFRSKPRDFLTPPYVTAKPEITTTKIDQKSKFMVLASDGLFELLSNEEIAGLIVKWMEVNIVPKPHSSAPNGKLPKIKDLSSDKDLLRPAFRYQSTQKRSGPEYLMEDTNVATHLIRNALSAGGRKEYVSTLVSIPSPMSRKYRDDLTVTVVFFGDSDNEPQNIDGSIVVNNGATSQLKSKL